MKRLLGFTLAVAMVAGACTTDRDDLPGNPATSA